MSVHSVHSLSIYRTETFNNFELNLIVSDVRRHLVLIRVMYNFNMYTLSTPHVDTVIIHLKCILPFTADEVKFLTPLYISAP